MVSAPPVGRRFFPLDAELELLPGVLTPDLHEKLVLLGTWMPFAQAAQMLEMFSGVHVSEATARRDVEQAGAAYVGVQAEAAKQIALEPPVSDEADRLLLSVDGAFVHLVGGEWAEVKTLAIGEVDAPAEEGGELVVHARATSYFSRLTDADTFAEQAVVETHRRGLMRAKQVVAVSDGAEWIQGFIDWHRPDSLRVLDFAHAAGRLQAVAQLIWGEESDQTRSWFEAQAHRLKHEGPAGVLRDLAELEQMHPDLAGLAEHRRYLEKRTGQMDYPRYQDEGWPIGSGAVESGNKQVVEARLKGAGMRWARPHVNALLGLRIVVCNGRWHEGWGQMAQHIRQHMARHRLDIQERHRKAAPSVGLESAPKQVPLAQSVPATAVPDQVRSRRPAVNHPWRRLPIQTERLEAPPSDPVAKT